jgi:hypothetical protein
MGKYLSHNFPFQNGLKQGDALSPLLFNFTLEYAIKKVHEIQVGIKLNGRNQLLVYAADVNLLGDNVYAIKENTGTLIHATKEVGLEVNAKETKYILPSHHQNAGQVHDIMIANGLF